MLELDVAPDQAAKALAELRKTRKATEDAGIAVCRRFAERFRALKLPGWFATGRLHLPTAEGGLKPWITGGALAGLALAWGADLQALDLEVRFLGDHEVLLVWIKIAHHPLFALGFAAEAGECHPRAIGDGQRVQPIADALQADMFVALCADLAAMAAKKG